MSKKTALALSLGLCVGAAAQTSTLPILGYAKTSVNTVVFRGNSVVTFGQIQYTAYYDKDSNVVIAKRTLGTTDWATRTTQHKGNVSDAHNSISIEVDGDGFLHMAWNTHSNALKYCKGAAANSMEMGSATAMVGTNEANVTYPQFFRRPDGNLLFFYRDGASGNGNLMVNKYDVKAKQWTRLQSNLIAGEGTRNAYWQAYQDVNGVIHVGWVWRETSDVSTNHDQCYAKSEDGGVTWKTSTGTVYTLPIKAANAEYVYRIAQKSDLINQTTIFGDSKSRPYIATYWTPAGTGIPQYHLIYNLGGGWQHMQITQRTTAYSLSGGGTKQIPFSRPQLVVQDSKDSIGAYMVYRDVERGYKVSMAKTSNLGYTPWTVSDLTSTSVNYWEPSYDVDLWNASKLLHVFVQNSMQGDAETPVEIEPQPVQILEWKSETTAGIPAPRRMVAGRSLEASGEFDALGREAVPGASGVTLSVKSAVFGGASAVK